VCCNCWQKPFRATRYVTLQPTHTGTVHSKKYLDSTTQIFVDSLPADSIHFIQDEDENIPLRFSSVGRLYQSKQQHKKLAYQQEDDPTSDAINSCSAENQDFMGIVDKLSKSTVAIFGIGGVGSWAAEAIGRSGVGNIILVDLDDICTSNINRQLHALTSTVGQMKIDQMKKRLLDINPSCNVTLLHDFVGQHNADEIVKALKPNVDVILDAIDGTDEKAALIAAACRNNVTIVTCGGAAGRVDPTQIVCGDLSKSNQCRLLFWVKKELRDKYKLFPKGLPEKEVVKSKNSRLRPWRIWAVYSEEPIIYKQQSAGESDSDSSSSLRTCDGPLGTACFVTGTYGFVAASKVISMLALDELIKPRILKSALSIPFQDAI
jgi:tRNA A37 threonylcarbamoyladenosine dehydratase